MISGTVWLPALFLLMCRIDFAGDSIFPHLHYSLMDGPEVFKAWGLPAHFLRFHRVLGATSIKV